LFSFTTASTAERIIAPILGLYLGYAVVRLPEVFPVFEVPRGPMILMLVFLGMLGLAVPQDAWSLIWKKSGALRCVGALLGLAVATAEIGIWPTNSFTFIKENYIISVAIFVICMVFLRDRKNFRIAITVYVLCVAAVSYNVVRTYDPNSVVLNDDGDPVAPEIVAARPELRRLQIVGEGLDSNDFGAILVSTFPLALWLSVGSFKRRVFWTGIAVLLVMAVTPTQSRGAELGFAAAAAVVVSVGAKGWRRWLSFALVAGCIAVFVMMAAGIGAAARFSDFGEDDYNLSNEGRWFFWKQGFVWMLKRPWGYGIENFPTYFGIMNGPERAAHSSWVQYGMELGVTGITIFVVLCVWLVRSLRKHQRRAAALADVMPQAKDEQVLGGHMLALLAGVLVTGSFLSNAYYPLMYMALGLAAAVLLGSPLPDVVPDSLAKPGAATPALRSGGAPRRRLRRFPGDVPAG
jgi:hypothetical protein